MLQAGEHFSLGERAWVRLTLNVAGVPTSGIAVGDLEVLVLRQDAAVFSPVDVTGAMWRELTPPSAAPYYTLEVQSSWADTPGALLLLVRPSLASLIPFDVAAVLCFVSDNESRAAGILQDRDAWVPVYLSNGVVPVTGLLLPSSIQVAADPDNTYTPVLPSSATFREVTYLGNPTGVYQVRPGASFFAYVGFLSVDISDLSIDSFFDTYPIVSASARRVEVTVEDTNGSVSGVTVIASLLETGDRVASAQTDPMGQCFLDLSEGDYLFTKSLGGEVFNTNNHSVTVRNPNTEMLPAEPALLAAGNEDPYALQEGDTLTIRVSGGATQTITFTSSMIPPGYVLTSLPAHILASVLTRSLHSLKAYASGVGSRYLFVESLQVDAEATLEVLGGSANTVLNLPTEMAIGKDFRRASNRVYLDGSRFQPISLVNPADSVLMHYRAVDLEGSPVRGQIVRITNKMSPAVRASDGSFVIGSRVLDCITDRDGTCRVRSGPRQGEIPRLLKGLKMDVVIQGTGIARFDLTVPTTDFYLMDLISQTANDLVQLQKPLLPLAPRS